MVFTEDIKKLSIQQKKIADEKGLKLAVMTFNHHPAVVFQKIDHKKNEIHHNH